MAHFFNPQTNAQTDFFHVNACGAIRASLWNVGGPELYIVSDNAAIAAVSSSSQPGPRVLASTGTFNFVISGVRPGNVLIKATNTSGAQWALTQAVVKGGTLCLDSRGGLVQEMQQRLNCHNPTRLPRLIINGVFDVMTKARVMEFQYNQGLAADGIAGPKTSGKLGTAPANCTGGGPLRWDGAFWSI